MQHLQDRSRSLAGHEQPRKVTLGEITEMARVVISLVVSLIGVLAARKNLSSGIWVPIGLGLTVAVLLVFFIFILKREPSKVLQLRQKLVSAYVDRLAESIRGSGVTGKA